LQGVSDHALPRAHAALPISFPFTSGPCGRRSGEQMASTIKIARNGDVMQR